ncbi:CotH kinase family protein [Thermophilibacter provencensis]|uniref:CotH kinase family protein n=1 Tax=Thermophilibacter provencensis TaxID=1852386 RepID=UPI00094B71A1|nr:CotH kinase family protein [Thermophilibacter provencensis]
MRAPEKIAVAASLALATSLASQMGAPSVASAEEICPDCVQESTECDSLEEERDILEDPLQDSEGVGPWGEEGPSEDGSEEPELGDDVTNVPGSALDAGDEGDGLEGEGDVPSGDSVLVDDGIEGPGEAISASDDVKGEVANDSLPETPSNDFGVTQGDSQMSEASEAHDQAEEEKVTRPDGWYLDEEGFWRWSQANKDLSGWLVTEYLPGHSAGSGLQRYWLEDGRLVHFDEVFQATTDGVSEWFYATNQGYVSRGKLVAKRADGTYVYLSDNEGRLEDAGWLVTGKYDGGTLQRYWIDADARAAVVGQYSSEGGYGHVTGEQGHTVRGTATVQGRRYIADNDGRLTRNTWVVTGAFAGGNLERYWAGETGAFVVDTLVNAGGGYFAYATSSGAVVRGSHRVGNLVYLADNDGRLAHSGWVVTDVYGQGLQRYWIDPQKHAAVIGYSKAGYGHYTLETGYVLRGKYDTGRGLVYVADNDGRLAVSQAPGADGSGWLITGVYDGGALQRYWIDGKSGAARSGLFNAAASAHYGLAGQGYVLRSALTTSYGSVYADNDGVLKESGWLVTDAFGAGLQRYWFDDCRMVTHSLIDAKEAGWWAYARPEGYVVRGKYVAGDGRVYLANNDGKLENPGWLITGAYDGGGLQRYYIDGVTRAAKTGVFQVGPESYLGLSGRGYVLRGTTRLGDQYYRADNDGMLVLSFFSSVGTREGEAAASVVSTFVGDMPYLFLPSHADISKVSLGFRPFDGSESILISFGDSPFVEYESGVILDLGSLAKGANGARVVRFKTSAGARERTLSVMISANVGSMYLISDDPINEGRPFVDGSPDHSTKAKGTMLYVLPDGTVVYNGELTQIKGRGNTTWGNSAKKPYQIKLDKKADLLGLGDDEKAKTWVLLANANDATLVHNTLAYQLAQMLGLSETPQSAAIDLYYDGEYRGSYLLCEKVEINGGRVDIDKLEDAIEEANPGVDLGELPLSTGSNKYGNTFQYVEGMNSPEDISGGYLVEFDAAYYRTERCWFMTSVGAFVVKGPENLSYQQMRYISEFVQAAINATVSGEDASKYLDVDSCTAVWAVNEFSKNIDWSASSAYYYLPSSSDETLDHVLYAGPIWDFDASFGIRNDFPEASDPTGACFPNNHLPEVWFTKNPVVSDEADRVISQELASAVEWVLGDGGEESDYLTLDQMVAQVRESQHMNQVLWGLTSFGNCHDPRPTYEENVAYLRSWLESRLAWVRQYYK